MICVFQAKLDEYKTGFKMIEYPSGTNHPISTSQNFTFTYVNEENEYPQLVKGTIANFLMHLNLVMK
ncbi:unnamed protein product [Dicrocoelium dendriticum]|nr:unnamed protein product [Dicrocoelium dendriticum]